MFSLENISFFWNHGEVFHALWVSAIVRKHQKKKRRNNEKLENALWLKENQEVDNVDYHKQQDRWWDKEVRWSTKGNIKNREGRVKLEVVFKLF